MKEKEINRGQKDTVHGHLSDWGKLEVQVSANSKRWLTGVCPHCGFTRAAVDPDDILWCPACGYSKKGVFT